MSNGAGSRNVALAMAFKSLLSAEGRRCRVNASHLAVPSESGVKFLHREAQMLQVDTSEDRLFVETAWAYVASEVLSTAFANVSALLVCFLRWSDVE